MPTPVDLPPGVPAYAAGAVPGTPLPVALPVAQPVPVVQPIQPVVPTVAQVRSTGLPVSNQFQPVSLPPQQQGAPVLPPTLLDRALDLSNRAQMGMRKLLGMQGGNVAQNPTAQMAEAGQLTGVSTAAAQERTNNLESSLNELERRSSPPATAQTVMQARQAAATAQRKPY